MVPLTRSRPRNTVPSGASISSCGADTLCFAHSDSPARVELDDEGRGVRELDALCAFSVSISERRAVERLGLTVTGYWSTRVLPARQRLMTKKQPRDSRYFESRLKREHPRIYADWQAGLIPEHQRCGGPGRTGEEALPSSADPQRLEEGQPS